MNPDIARYEATLKRLIAITEAETSMLAFTRLMMPSPRWPDDPDHSRYETQRFHEVICAALEELAAGRMRRLIINVPPRHGKTQLASKMFIAWFAGLHPELSTIFGTYNEKFSQDIGRAVRDILLSPPYAQVFPNTQLKIDSKASDRLETTAGGILAFVGRGGTTTGRGGDLLVIDDPIKDRQEADSPTIRDTLWTWFIELHGGPELLEAFEAPLQLVAGDDAGIERPDRGADHPVRLDPCLMQRLIDASLIGTERAAALHDQDNLAWKLGAAIDRSGDRRGRTVRHGGEILLVIQRSRHSAICPSPATHVRVSRTLSRLPRYAENGLWRPQVKPDSGRCR